MTTQNEVENAIINGIIQIAKQFDVFKTIETSDNKLNIYCDNIWQRQAILDSIDKKMKANYPDQDYKSIKHHTKDCLLEIILN